MTQDELNELRANVERGIAWLDANEPDWRPKIKLAIRRKKFSMGQCSRCVWGTLMGDYESVLKLYPLEGGHQFGKSWMVQHGFDLYSYYSQDFADLTQLWKEAL